MCALAIGVNDLRDFQIVATARQTPKAYLESGQIVAVLPLANVQALGRAMGSAAWADFTVDEE